MGYWSGQYLLRCDMSQNIVWEYFEISLWIHQFVKSLRQLFFPIFEVFLCLRGATQRPFYHAVGCGSCAEMHALYSSGSLVLKAHSPARFPFSLLYTLLNTLIRCAQPIRS